MIKKYWWLPTIIITYLTALSFIYPLSYANLSGDAVVSYLWMRDIFTHQGTAFSSTLIPGYNSYSIVYLFSYLIGFVTYNKPPTIFFTIVNYSELILLLIATVIFINLTKLNQYKLRTWFSVLALGIVIWTIICMLQGDVPQTVFLQISDEYLIFVDSFIIISIGWSLNIITSIKENNKLPLLSFSGFIIYSLYFSLTTLRFLSGAILAEVALIIVVLINGYQLKRTIPTSSRANFSYYKWLFVLALSLTLVFVIGYAGFFMLESYSSSARYILRGGQLTTAAAFVNGLSALKQYFSAFNSNLIALILRVSYIIVFLYGLKSLYEICFSTKSLKQFSLTQLFALLAIINFALVTLSGLFSHGVVFLATGIIAHYYELSAIFAFLSIISLMVSKLDRYTSLIPICAILGLVICSIGSVGYIYLHPLQANPILNCINLNKNKYHLHNGMADYWTSKPLSAQESDINMRFSIIGDGPSLTNYNWQSNLVKDLSNNNYVIYGSIPYRNSVLAEINSKVPHMDYQDIKCSATDNGLLVFSPETTKYIDKFRQTEFNNSKSWFYITNYGLGQLLWAKAPWNKDFINKYHEYLYYGSLLTRISPNLQYSVASDLSLNITGGISNATAPLLMNDMMIRSSIGKYYLSATYKTNITAHILVYDLTTRQVIQVLNLTPDKQFANLNFSITKISPIYLLIVADKTPSLNLTINDIKLGKNTGE